MTLGSLFDGSGGFPLAASLVGIEPVWASEIEPFCVEVTTKRFPSMKHLGDITKINGADIEPVDIISFGSPCQDLSLAGLRNGIEGDRSGLFFEAIRIIKEMRYATRADDIVRPRFGIWENVCGAFSSNNGRDFRVVLEEFARVKDPDAAIPQPQGWSNSGGVLGDDFSLAWRVLDAQYWGVPQRRRRIFLVGDFDGGVPEKYYLSAKACKGILRRASERGKKLPKILEDALISQINRSGGHSVREPSERFTDQVERRNSSDIIRKDGNRREQPTDGDDP